MPKGAPFYSKKPGEKFHHNNNKCVEGIKIDKRFLAQGTGQRELCNDCAKLNKEGK